MKTEIKMKHDLEMVIRYFDNFIEDIEDYQHKYRGNEEKLDKLQDILANKNPFGKDLIEVLHNLYEYHEDIKENL